MSTSSIASRPGELEPTTGVHPSASAAGTSLVVLDPNDPSTTLRAVLQHPGVNDGDLALLVVFPTAEYQARRRARLAAGVTAPYTIDHLEMDARRIAHRAGCEWIDPTGVEFEAIGAVGRLQDCVRMVVAARGYTQVYILPPRRTVWQRILGDADSSAALTRVLPTSVTVVSVEGAVDVVSAVEDGETIADFTVGPDVSVEK